MYSHVAVFPRQFIFFENLMVAKLVTIFLAFYETVFTRE
jgi:hypothetical protein